MLRATACEPRSGWGRRLKRCCLLVSSVCSSSSSHCPHSPDLKGWPCNNRFFFLSMLKSPTLLANLILLWLGKHIFFLCCGSWFLSTGSGSWLSICLQAARLPWYSSCWFGNTSKDFHSPERCLLCCYGQFLMFSDYGVAFIITPFKTAQLYLYIFLLKYINESPLR